MSNRFLNIGDFENPYWHELRRICGRKVGVLTEEFYFENLWSELLSNVLTSNGKAFSFEVPICTEYVLHDVRVPHLFERDYRIVREKYAETHNFETFQRAFSRLPSGITYTRQETCFRKVSEEELEQLKERFIRGEKNHFGKMEVEINGYTVFVNVEKSTSSKLFNDNYRGALGFKEKLLRDHKAILRECYEMIKGEGDGRASISWINSKKVLAWEDSEREKAVYFRSFGMVDLSTQGEIFGLASAIIELAKQEGRIKENARIKYRPWVSFQKEKADQEYYKKKMVLDGLSVSIEWDPEEKSTPSLKAW